MKQVLFFLILSVHLFSQNRIQIYEIDGNERDSVIYYSEGNKIFRCAFKQNIGNKDKCQIKEDIATNNKRYKAAQSVFKYVRETKTMVITDMPVPDSGTYNPNYGYDLPYKKGEVYKVTQGYNGTFSHFESYALDFNMPEGTEVLAARDGIVMEVAQSSNYGCQTNDCIKFGNYILILHSDGTIAGYHHLQFKGARVELGEQVRKGMIIGLSGNTGWSSQPHLHFVCTTKTYKNDWIQLKTLFRTGENGNTLKYLLEGRKYLRDY